MDGIHMAVTSGARLFRACEVISIGKRRYRRWINRISDDHGGYRAKNQALTQEEKDEVILQKKCNRRKSKVRCPVKHVFGQLKNVMNLFL